VDEAVARLDDMLNDKKGPALVSKEQIRARLLPGGAPGELAVKMSKGQPDFIISRRLFAKPIAGVMYGLPGVGLTQEPRRHYPYGAMASATLGWVGDVRVHPSGVFGLELSEEKLLRGVDGREVKEIDARRRTIPERSTRTEPQDGLDLMLTIDLNIQQAAEEELAKAVQSSHALQGQCIVMDPKTGEILAIATYPTWDANAPGKSPVPLLNPAISNFYEPGSTFKIVPVIGALEEKLVRDGQQVTYCSGTMPIGRRAIHEAHHAHGAVDCGRLLEQSCNLGAATLALKLGPTKFLHWCEALGYGAKTGIELENESPGSLNRRNIEAKITLANMGFGQSLAVTPLQMVAAYSAVANGGEWIQPHLIKSRQNTDRTTWTAFTAPRRRVCAPETAALLRKYLERVVAQGTGTAAAVSGYRVGGKTGTAQKPPYYARKYIGSFIGVMPMDNPRLAIIAVIDEPKTSIYGGVVAGPVVAGVGQRALQYLSIPPTLPVKAAKKTTP
ncbi:MAG TPA: penicillin-binding protein 2, partial [Armatimonadota bacterium]|jgi:cell division protein FtsI/penicillin-binding protein 2